MNTTSTWQTIDNAPKDRPILTNLGLAIHWFDFWYMCDSYGNVPECFADGAKISLLNDTPRIWTEFNPPQINRK